MPEQIDRCSVTEIIVGECKKRQLQYFRCSCRNLCTKDEEERCNLFFTSPRDPPKAVGGDSWQPSVPGTSCRDWISRHKIFKIKMVNTSPMNCDNNLSHCSNAAHPLPTAPFSYSTMQGTMLKHIV